MASQIAEDMAVLCIKRFKVFGQVLQATRPRSLRDARPVKHLCGINLSFYFTSNIITDILPPFTAILQLSSLLNAADFQPLPPASCKCTSLEALLQFA